METKVHGAKNLKGSVYLKKPSEDGPPREKRGIEPFKSLLEFLRTHPHRNPSHKSSTGNPQKIIPDDFY
jgi:hypothetical protein